MYQNLRNYLILCGLILISFYSYSQGIVGVINDQYTKEPIPGVTLEIKSLKLATQTSPSGYFEFKNVPVGKYSISIRYIGYGSQTQIIEVNESNKLKLNFSITETATQLKEVKVQGRMNRETDISARRKEKNAYNLVNVVSAQTIQGSADLNAADVSKRISGISLLKNPDSKDEFLVIRGLEPRYGNSTINGVQIPSPDDKNKTIPLNIFPAELIGSVVVSKTLTPDQALDAIAGTVDIQFKDAPSQELLELNLAGGYNSKVTSSPFYTFNPKVSHRRDPAALYGHQYSALPSYFPYSVLRFTNPTFTPNLLGGFTYGRRFLKNKLGLILSASGQDNYSVEDQVEQGITEGVNYTAANGNEPFTTEFSVIRRYYFHSNNIGISSKIDYIFNEKNRLNFSAVYTRTQNLQSLINVTLPTVGANKIINGLPRIDSTLRSLNIIQSLINANLKGIHKISSKFTLDYTLCYSYARAEVPDQAENDLYNDKLKLDSVSGSKPRQYFLDRPNQYIVNPNSTLRFWQRNYDRYYGAYLNLSYKVKLFKNPSEFKFGGIISHKNRNNYRNQYILDINNVSGQSATVFTPQINETNFIIKTPLGDPSVNNNNYQADELLEQFYFMNRFKWKKIEFVIGFRDEITHQSNFEPSVDAPLFTTNHHDYFYNDFSPEINFKYSLDPKQAVRLAYYQAISRPNYYELTSYTNNSGSGNQDGNPNLRHTRSFNFDGRYELFPNNDDALLIGGFFKKLIDPIERSYTSGNPVLTTQLFNAPSAVDYGAEFNLIKYYGDFGVSGNYTFTVSRIKDSKKLDVRTLDSTGMFVYDNKIPNIIRPLQGQSRDLANLSLLYRNQRAKINANFAVLFQGRRIDASQPFLNGDYYQLNYWNFSFSADKTFGNRLTVFFKGNNLTNAPIIIRTTNGYFISSNRFGQDFLFGVRWKILGGVN